MDDFEEAFRKAAETGVRVPSGSYSTVRELPDGAVQMYLQDPSGNLVEVNWRDIGTLGRRLIPAIRKVGGPRDAVLYMDPEGVVG